MADLSPPSQLGHAELLAWRNRLPSGHPAQKTLGPAEHRAFAREWTRESPLVAVPSLLAAIPAYTLAKRLGVKKARTVGSLDEMAEAYRGMREGAYDALRRLVYGD